MVVHYVLCFEIYIIICSYAGLCNSLLKLNTKLSYKCYRVSSEWNLSMTSKVWEETDYFTSLTAVQMENIRHRNGTACLSQRNIIQSVRSAVFLHVE